MVAHTSSTGEADIGRSRSSSQLVYRASSKTARATQRNPVSKQTNKQTKQKLKNRKERKNKETMK